PFKHDSMEELRQRVLETEPPDPRQFAPDIPGELVNICNKALAKSRGERYATAAQMAGELYSWIKTLTKGESRRLTEAKLLAPPVMEGAGSVQPGSRTVFLSKSRGLGLAATIALVLGAAVVIPFLRHGPPGDAKRTEPGSRLELEKHAKG